MCQEAHVEGFISLLSGWIESMFGHRPILFAVITGLSFFLVIGLIMLSLIWIASKPL